MGAELSIPGFGWSQSSAAKKVQIENIGTLRSGTISFEAAVEALVANKPELALEFPSDKVKALSRRLMVEMNKTFSDADVDDVRETQGKSNGRQLVFSHMTLGEDMRFGLHAHPNIKVIYVIQGEISEYRMRIDDGDRTIVDLGKVPTSPGHCTGPDLSSLERPVFVRRTTTAGNFLLNEKGSIHMTFTSKFNGAQLLVLWGSGHANIEKLPKAISDKSTGYDDMTTVKVYLEKMRQECFENVLPFWLSYSSDTERGGFWCCLDKSGEVYDTRKFMWLNGRQIYMYACIAYSYSEEELRQLSNGTISRKQMLADATAAADFMYENGVREDDGRVYFSLTKEGTPYHMERKIFSACFLCLGLGTLAATLLKDGDGNGDDSRGTGERLRKRCLVLLDSVVSWSHDPTPLKKEACPGAPVISPMNVPMILLNILTELQRVQILGTSSSPDPKRQQQRDDWSILKEEQWCVSEILKHVREDEKLVLEVVQADGSKLEENSYEARHMNPGHAIEAGWFVMQYALKTANEELFTTGEKMVMWSFERGWDTQHGGVLYFLDAEGRSPPYLEWDMKLWWPHCEAMIAFAMLYKKTKDDKYLRLFTKVTDYALSHFSDAGGGGEWVGYLNRRGEQTHRFKGGPYKGCFHVPRALFMVFQLLNSIVNPYEDLCE